LENGVSGDAEDGYQARKLADAGLSELAFST
jgi:hypothetical protein